MRCPFCGAANRAGMTFCCECGESLDPATASARAGGAPRRAGPATTGRRRPSWEILLGLVLLLSIGTVAAVMTWQDAARAEQARAYDQGELALNRGNVVAAAAAFGRAGAYRDAPAQYTRLAAQVQALAAHYDAGMQAAARGAWWDADHELRQAAGIQVSYRDVLTRLEAAQARVGPLFYTRPDLDGTPVLWWANADGSTARRLPFAGAGAAVLGVSPDNHWAVYTAGSDPDPSAEGPFLLDLTSAHVGSLEQKYRDLSESTPRVVFRADSSGFWWIFDAQNLAFYYDLAKGAGLPANEVPGDIDTLHGRLVLNHFLIPEVGHVHTRLLLSNPLGGERTLLTDDPGEVTAPRFSDDGRYVLYALAAMPVRDPAGHRVTTTTLVLYELAARGSPASRVLDALRTTVDDQPVGALRAAFAPDSDTIVIYRRDNAGWVLQARAPDGDPVRLASAPAPSGAPQALLAVPGAPLLAAALPAAGADRTTLALLSLSGGRTVVIAGAPAARWLSFAPDGGHALLSLADPDSGGSASAVQVVSLDGAAAGRPVVRGVASLAEVITTGAPSTLPRWSADGGRVLALGDFGLGPGLYAVHANGADPLLLVPGASAFWTAADPAPGLWKQH